MGGVNAAFAYGPEKLVYADANFSKWAPKTAELTVITADVRYRLAEKISVGVDFAQYASPEYNVMTQAGKVNGTFTPKDMKVGLGVEYIVMDGIAVSAKVHYASSAIAEEVSGKAICGDVNVNYSNDILKAGAGVCNLGTKISYGESSYALPAYARVGAAYTGLENLVAGAEVDYLLSGGVMAGIGAEYTVVDIVSVRAGYHYGPKDAGIPSFLSLGLGAGFKGVAVNVAYVLGSEALTNSLNAGISVNF